MPKRRSSSESSLLTHSLWLGRWFTAARREGFLALLSPDSWHTLSAILSFTTHEGRRIFTLDQLAAGLAISREQARYRLRAVAETLWSGMPLLTIDTASDGEIAGATLAPVELLTSIKSGQETQHDSAAAPAAQNEELALALSAVGLNSFQIDWLLRTFPDERIRTQLQWLPAREAHNPPALLIRAIEQNWDPPKAAA